MKLARKNYSARRKKLENKIKEGKKTGKKINPNEIAKFINKTERLYNEGEIGEEQRKKAYQLFNEAKSKGLIEEGNKKVKKVKKRKKKGESEEEVTIEDIEEQLERLKELEKKGDLSEEKKKRIRKKMKELEEKIK